MYIQTQTQKGSNNFEQFLDGRIPSSTERIQFALEEYWEQTLNNNYCCLLYKNTNMLQKNTDCKYSIAFCWNCVRGQEH